MATREAVSFRAMLKTFPLRTALFTFGPLAIGLVQLLNGYLNGASLLVTAGLAALLIAFSVMVTQYHLATFRRRRLTTGLENGI